MKPDAYIRISFAVLCAVLLLALFGCEASVEEADASFKEGNHARAVKQYKSVLAQDKILKSSEKAAIFYKLGKSYEKLGDLEEAVKAYKESVDLKPDDPVVYMALADNLDRMGNYRDEIWALQSALTLDPDNPHTESMMGSAYARLGQYTNAISVFHLAAQHNPRDPQNFVNLGMAYDRQGFRSKAIFFWNEALKIAPDNENALINLGAVYNVMKQYDKAAETYKALSIAYPRNLDYRMYYGISLYNMGKFRAALAAFTEVQGIAPGHPGVEDNIRLAKRAIEKSSVPPGSGGK